MHSRPFKTPRGRRQALPPFLPARQPRSIRESTLLQRRVSCSQNPMVISASMESRNVTLRPLHHTAVALLPTGGSPSTSFFRFSHYRLSHIPLLRLLTDLISSISIATSRTQVSSRVYPRCGLSKPAFMNIRSRTGKTALQEGAGGIIACQPFSTATPRYLIVSCLLSLRHCKMGDIEHHLWIPSRGYGSVKFILGNSHIRSRFQHKPSSKPSQADIPARVGTQVSTDAVKQRSPLDPQFPKTYSMIHGF